MPKIVVHPTDPTMHMFWDPAMQEPNAFYVGGGSGRSWSWNGDAEKPTVNPSVLLTRPGMRNHLFIRDGKLQYLSDCTHELAGRTVEMVDFPEDWL